MARRTSPMTPAERAAYLERKRANQTAYRRRHQGKKKPKPFKVDFDPILRNDLLFSGVISPGDRPRKVARVLAALIRAATR